MSYPIRVGANALILRENKLLLIEFDDSSGLHYNLPGGGIEAGESVKEGMKREVREETSAEVGVGELAFVYEYEPKRNGHWGGNTHKLGLIFRCTLVPSSEPRLPQTPDAYQIGVHWTPLSKLPQIELLPHLGKHIQDYLKHPPGAVFLEEPLEPSRLKRYLNP